MDDDRAGAGALTRAAALAIPAVGGLRLNVRLTPKSSADRIEGIAEDAAGRLHLKARVRAVPEKGRANDALVALLAERLELPVSSVSIVAGHGARMKTVAVAGDRGELHARLARLAGGAV